MGGTARRLSLGCRIDRRACVVATPRGGRESEELHAAARSWPEKKGGHTSAREVPLGKVAADDSNPPS
jgi:hypothetical protein